MSETKNGRVLRQIRKRDGSLTRFDKNKITVAVGKALSVADEGNRRQAEMITEKVLDILRDRCAAKKAVDVETVQDAVEEALMSEGFHQTAKAYILYRQQRTVLRRARRSIEAAADLIDDYIGQKDWRVRENANMAYSLQGLNNHIASHISTAYWMKNVYPSAVRRAHEEGDFHIHDLQLISAYCCGWDLQDLLKRGFGGVPGKVECDAPKHFGSALGQMVNFIYTLQGEVAGAQAFSNFDTLLAPFVRFDKLSYREVKQHLQTFVYNMNISTRVGFQTPFSNITLDIVVPEALRDKSVIVGGRARREKYGEFQKEMDLINRAFAEVMMEGDAAGRVFTFPIPTYNIDKNFDWEDDRFEPIWEMTAKYGIPYFANFVNSDMSPDDARSMCPLAGTEKVLIRSSRGRDVEYAMIRQVYEGCGKQEEYEIYSDGQFVKGRFNRFRNQKMIKVTLANGHEIRMSQQHLNFVLTDSQAKESVIKGKELTVGMYLPYSLKTYSGRGGNAELGFFVGAFAGDGSFDSDTAVVFSLENNFKKDLIAKLERIAAKYFGAHCSVAKHSETKLVTLRVNSRAAVGLCKDFVEGKGRRKRYRAKLFVMSRAFREGVLAGHYATDGGNRHRIYTSSKSMVETLNMLSATLGTTSSVYKDDREGRLGTEPNYAVLIYQLNRQKYGDVWFKKYAKLWVRIKKIEPIANTTAYCFEVKRGTPVFTVGSTGILTHNCRLRLDNRQLRRRGGGLFGANPLTGSIGVVTINLPRLGYVSADRREFLRNLDALMDLAKESLEIKRQTVERLTEQGLYPYTKVFLSGMKKLRGSYWGNHFSTIGLVGMNEAAENLLGVSIVDEEGRKFAAEVLDHMRSRLEKYQEETGNLYNLEATPAEGTAYRLAKLDQKLHPKIIFANDEDVRRKKVAPYYTNSSHLPVGYTEDIFHALDLQDELQTKYTGGTVLHGFLGERLWDTTTTKLLVRRIAESYRLPYFTLTPTFSICARHGYLVGEQRRCERCGRETEVYSRVVGYIRPVKQWNAGKQAEYGDRREYVTEL